MQLFVKAPAVREKSDRKRIRQAARNIKKYLNTSKEDDK